ncbi:type II toxin-antitoxin system VapB family antitoxin [Enterovirga aerilata]|uniref:Type II toxin-antitoxin system VapB family antitoxin n=1 Tax=Enterovirga aerilata TaxID=2730920 RepID=A0A849I0G4_9HYPH|nr:type II toxin-antitoxin system VapB family antitoxin [Enterovirga sp. DB1703]NNM70891.1 type II toxin-antitoxin system VapB family antitoxin [Enterovirga sp. DB1703]
MAQRQLNIRSDEAAERASALAKRLGKTTTEVVVEALRSYDASARPVDELGMTPEKRRRYESILEIARETRKRIRPEATFDESWMYDENGLPK